MKAEALYERFKASGWFGMHGGRLDQRTSVVLLVGDAAEVCAIVSAELADASRMAAAAKLAAAASVLSEVLEDLR